MARFTNKKKVASKKITKPIIVNVYEKDGVINEVTTGGFLGVIPMNLIFGPNPFATGVGIFKGKNYPIEVYVNSLGNVPTQKEYIGNAFVEDDVVMDVTPYISDYRLEALDEAQRVTLTHISTKMLHKEILSYIMGNHNGVGWTPWLSAIQEADQVLGLPKSTWTPQYQDVEGRKAIGCDIVVDVNGARFLFGEGGFVRCAGRNLYQFWTDAAIGVFPDGDKYYPAEETDD